MTKEFFKEHNIAYQEKDVSTDQAAVEEMIKKSGQMGVPAQKRSLIAAVIFTFNNQKTRVS